MGPGNRKEIGTMDGTNESQDAQPRNGGQGRGVRALVERHHVAAYFALTFAVSWLGIMLVIGGPSGLASTPEEATALMPPAVLALLVGPTVASLTLTGIISGRAGLRELLSRLGRWRVGGRWYAFAILSVPLLYSTVLLALSAFSSDFVPAIVTTDDKASLLVMGLVFGLIGGFLEETGWTGFAIPRLRQRHGVLGTGLIVGVPWQVWHLPINTLVAIGSHGDLPLATFLPVFFLSCVAQLTASRVLMVWLHDRTGSLLVVALMHVSLAASTTLILLPPATGVAMLAQVLGLSAALWAIAALAVTRAGRGVERPVPLAAS